MNAMHPDFEPSAGTLDATGGSGMPPALARVRETLLQRVRGSVLAHRAYTTLRHEDYRWTGVAPGMRAHCLRQDGLVKVSLWRLQAGAAMVWPDAAQCLELLVVQGGLEPTALDPAGALAANDYLVCNSAEQLTAWRASGPCTVYVRQRDVALARLPALEAHWWGLAQAQAGQPKRRKWRANAPGVEVLPLCGDAQVISMLVRFAPGASVPDHHHALDEDCLVLQGEMFLGDLLLRSGDYQLAPAGGSHFGENSDVGVVFFFHGALDPVLL